MSKEMEFYIYLLEKYAAFKNVSVSFIINKLDELQLTDLVYNMYDRYHIESLDNAYKDIDNLIRERETM